MTNEEFIRAEMAFESAVELFKAQCEDFDLDPAGRIVDVLLRQDIDLE